MENRDIDGEFTIVGNWKTSYWSAEKWACEHEINFFSSFYVDFFFHDLEHKL